MSRRRATPADQAALPAHGSAALRHAATRYAQQVIAGKIAAGPHVRDACRRHLRDLDAGPKRGIRFDARAADWALGFFGDVLTLAGGEYEGKAFQLLPWQRFVVASLFGWIKSDGARRFRMAFIEAGKGCGKSPLLAGIALYLLAADREARAEVYMIAAKRDQAMVMYRDALAMVEQSPGLAGALTISRGIGVENIAHVRSHSFLRPVAGEDRLSGPRPHGALLDEIHEHRNEHAVTMMRAGTKHRKQPLIAMITNSGHDRNSVAYHYHEYGIKVARGEVEDDSFFSYVCALDDDDDPFADERCWAKTNPSLPYGLPGYEYLRREVNQARNMPAARAEVERLAFCRWTDAASPWIGYEVWTAAGGQIDLAQYAGRRAYVGLDLSAVRDLTAAVLAIPPAQEGEPWILIPRFWLPREGLREREDIERVPYFRWAHEGHLRTTTGHAIDRREVARELVEWSQRFDVRAVAYDRWGMSVFRQVLQDEGIELPLVEFGQGYKDMAPAVNEFERLLVGGHLKHDNNPAMTMCAANAVLEVDPAGNRKPTKKKATGRIDGIVAAVMAVGIASARLETDGAGYYASGGTLMVI